MKTKRPLTPKYDYHALVILGYEGIVEALKDNLAYCGIDSRTEICYASTILGNSKGGCGGYACYNRRATDKLVHNQDLNYLAFD